MPAKLKNCNITIEDLPDDFREVAEAIGFEAAMKLVSIRPGEPLYIPHPKELERPARDREICLAFNGRNYRELAHRYGLTPRWVRHIVAQGAGTLVKRNPKQRGLPGF